jgi:hypothetical protein
MNLDRMNFSSDDVINGADDDVEIAMEIDRNDSTAMSAPNEDPFWTKEQLLLLKHFPPNAFLIMGLIVSIIGIFGLTANGTVLFIFSKYNPFLLATAVDFRLIKHIFMDLLHVYLFVLADSNDSDHHQPIRSSSIWPLATCRHRCFTPWPLIPISTAAGPSVVWAANFTPWESLASVLFLF